MFGRLHDIGDAGVGHRAIRDDHEVAVEIANACAAQPDGLHAAVDRIKLDAVAHLERLVSKERHRAKQVRERILRGQADRQSADGEQTPGPAWRA